jgi:hypothetical protein
MDALDFNIIMSPEDMWVGNMNQKDDGTIVITTRDTTCTAPVGIPVGDGRVEFPMPDRVNDDTLLDYREGAEEGYIEIIGMGQPDTETSPLAVGALHEFATDIPADCVDVRRNFFRVDDANRGNVAFNGVHTNSITSNGTALTNYLPTPADALTVSWAVTDGNAGLEVGGNAVHINGFGAAMGPAITNQQTIVLGAQDALGYFFPDLDGGSPGFGTRGLYDSIIRPVLGVSGISNDWSSRAGDGFSVNTDWVVTMPGQYVMLDPLGYNAALALDDPLLCLPSDCDFRDIPVELLPTFRNREERGFTPEEGGLVISPSVSATPDGFVLPYEVNVIEWQKDGSPVFGSDWATNVTIPVEDSDRGWIYASVKSAPNKTQAVYDYLDPNTPVPVTEVTQVPLIGFAAWERNFDASPDANYGRAVDHSYGSYGENAPGSVSP